MLPRQLFPLRAWIEARQDEGAAWMVVGDFNRRLDAGAGTFQDEMWSALSGYAPRPGENEGEIEDIDERDDVPLFRSPYKEASLCWREMREPYPALLAEADDYHLVPIEFFLFGQNARTLLAPESGKQIPWPAPQERDPARLSDHCPETIKAVAG